MQLYHEYQCHSGISKQRDKSIPKQFHNSSRTVQVNHKENTTFHYTHNKKNDTMTSSMTNEVGNGHKSLTIGTIEGSGQQNYRTI